MSEKKSSGPTPEHQPREDRPLTDPQESFDNIIEIPADVRRPLQPV